MVGAQWFPDPSVDRSPKRSRPSRVLILLGTWESRAPAKWGCSERDLCEPEFETQRGEPLIHPAPPPTAGFNLKRRMEVTNMWWERGQTQYYTGCDCVYKEAQTGEKTSVLFEVRTEIPLALGGGGRG